MFFQSLINHTNVFTILAKYLRNWIHTLKGVPFVSRMFTKKEYNKHAFSGNKHLWQYHLTYISQKDFQVCSRIFCGTTYNIRRSLPKVFYSYKIKQLKWFCEYIFYDFHHYVEIRIVHFRLDNGVSAFSFWKCWSLLGVFFSDKYNE